MLEPVHFLPDWALPKHATPDTSLLESLPSYMRLKGIPQSQTSSSWSRVWRASRGGCGGATSTAAGNIRSHKRLAARRSCITHPVRGHRQTERERERERQTDRQTHTNTCTDRYTHKALRRVEMMSEIRYTGRVTWSGRTVRHRNSSRTPQVRHRALVQVECAQTGWEVVQRRIRTVRWTCGRTTWSLCGEEPHSKRERERERERDCVCVCV